MAIPKYNELYNEILEILADGKIYNHNDIVKLISDKIGLSDAEKVELLSSGKMTVIKSRVSWSITYLKKAGLIESNKRNHSNITEEGLRVLNSNNSVNNDYLLTYDSFREFIQKSKKSKGPVSKSSLISLSTSTPEELLNNSYLEINNELASKLLNNILENSPIFFERLVVELLLKMGYGNYREDAGFNTSATNYEGIDGIINEDKLGLEKIGIQAKRYTKDNVIGRPAIQKFVGALQGKHLNKGVFITSSSFSTNAIEYAESQGNTSIILIDGDALTKLMIEYDLGVSTETIYKIKKIDNDFFEE